MSGPRSLDELRTSTLGTMNLGRAILDGIGDCRPMSTLSVMCECQHLANVMPVSDAIAYRPWASSRSSNLKQYQRRIVVPFVFLASFHHLRLLVCCYAQAGPAECSWCNASICTTRGMHARLQPYEMSSNPCLRCFGQLCFLSLACATCLALPRP